MEKEIEIWKEIKGYERCYHVSNLGRVKSIGRLSENNFAGTIFLEERILKHTNSHGYRSVVFSLFGKVKTMSVHRLVAQAFIPNPENKCDVNHINGIKHDNRVENLEWNTRSENCLHAFKTGLFVISKDRNCKEVINLEYGIFYDSLIEAAFTTHYSAKYLGNVLRGKKRNKTRLEYVKNK